MREILFRGFHPCEDGDKTVYADGKAVKGRWVYGGYWLNDTATRQTPHIIDCNGDTIQVIPSTVGQYTELDDMDGAKIFEGDIIYDAYNQEAGIIFYCLKQFKYRVKDKENEIKDFDELYYKALKVVGNIHKEVKTK